jgi:C-terminal processing protease CtpA/Prc
MPLLPLLALTLAQAPILTPETKTQTVDALFAAMRREYVFPDLAKTAETSVRGQDYAAITDGQAFAKRLTDDLQAVCKDAHLRIRYSAAVLPERKNADDASPAEIERIKRNERLDNGAFQKVERLTGNIGYIRLDGFYSPEAAKGPLKAAMDFVSQTDALIIDLRGNGGGYPETVQMFCSYLFDKPVHLNDIYDRTSDKTESFWTKAKVPGKKYLNREVYVLTGKRTGSGAEEFAYDLQTQKRATIVGESTWGGANPGHVVRLNDHFAAFVPTGRAINPITKTNWEGTGVTPDVKVPVADALKTAQTMAIERLLAKATAEDEKSRLGEALAWVKEH